MMLRMRSNKNQRNVQNIHPTYIRLKKKSNRLFIIQKIVCDTEFEVYNVENDEDATITKNKKSFDPFRAPRFQL